MDSWERRVIAQIKGEVKLIFAFLIENDVSLVGTEFIEADGKEEKLIGGGVAGAGNREEVEVKRCIHLSR